MTLSCFELGERMLAVEEARAAVLALVAGPLPAELVPLAQAHGRVLAEDAISPIAVPQNTNSAMDGIALAWPAAPGEDCAPVTRFRRVVELHAGQTPAGPLAPGECAGITTGAPLPPGADTVIMREQLADEQGADGTRWAIVDRPERVRRGQNVRRAGEDIARGALALAAGTRLAAAELGLLASLGLAEVAVHRRPRVALFSTGDEVTAPGQPLPAAGIFDANRFSLMALAAEHGAEVLDLGILPDARDAIAQALARAADEADLVITSGGVSVGDADHTRAALVEQGELGFWKIAIRPGRPLACGRLGPRGVPFLGLPGNPVAAMVTFREFAAPLLARLQGQLQGQRQGSAAAAPERLTALADQALASRVGRVDLMRGVYRCDADGRLRVAVTGAQGSGILSSMVQANCLIEIAAERAAVAAGEAVTIQPLFRFP
ncbi:gephyrin-like molybdotransferase Glp [Halomonas sp. A11-A]|uniref:molybdopterin molybdotransferase MoeA n=1 Tax=Halomonas sp. A11-A TaxID=2183985 RepID=UPI000D718DF4|nr:gephyrin-like molybdotransferase Glp [Halomonas sp. A11-A]PWV72685.1 molybdopterin molybdotransferase [Halomonas sp. A11-A]